MAFVEGVDVSHWQPMIDWPKLRAAGKLFVYVKATDGLVIKDRCFKGHWANAKLVGMLRGAYHFFQPHLDPFRQAAMFALALKDDPGELPPVLDLEETYTRLANSVRIQSTLFFLKEVERLLVRRPMIYTSAGFWNGSMYSAKTFGYPAWGDDYDLWIANYPYSNRVPSALELERLKPRLPILRKTWTIWQYTGSGIVPGVKGQVDCNRFNGSEDDLIKWAKAGLPPAPPVVPEVSNPTAPIKA